MSSPVVAVAPDTSLSEVARLLDAWGISGVPVLENGRLVGLVSEADLLRRHPGSPARSAGEVMTREVQTVGPDTPVGEVAALLEDRGIKRVPVVQEGAVVGIVSRSNLVQALAMQPAAPALRSQDEEIRRRLLAALKRAPWWHPAEANAIVRDGVVHFWGAVDTEAQREAAVAAARGIEGVRGVKDHRFTREPRAGARPSGTAVWRAEERGRSSYGLIDYRHSFCFGDYFDPARLAWGPLRALNEVRAQPGAGPATYGLRDIEILLYVLSGELAYEDSLDNAGRLGAGAVQHVGAGSGMRQHAGNASGSAPVRFLQIWIEPHAAGLLPCAARRHFPDAEKRGRLRLIASPGGDEGSLAIRQDVRVHAGLFDGGEEARLELGTGRGAYVHVARGRVTVNGHRLGEGDALLTDEGGVTLEKGGDAEALVIDLPAR